MQQALVQAGSWQQQRAFAQPAAQEDAAEPEEVPQKIKQLATDIMALSILECSQLSNILREKLGIPKGAAAMPMMAMPAAMPAAASAAAAADAAEPKEEKKEKTEFDVKLDSFTPEGKIKVIKEIRAITNLGLKEAKELVRACGKQRQPQQSQLQELRQNLKSYLRRWCYKYGHSMWASTREVACVVYWHCAVRCHCTPCVMYRASRACSGSNHLQQAFLWPVPAVAPTRGTHCCAAAVAAMLLPPSIAAVLLL
jgi:large subunit ribosomal protein L7/L12